MISLLTELRFLMRSGFYKHCTATRFGETHRHGGKESIMKPQVARLTLLTTATLVFLCSVNAFAQRGASLRGQVTDQFGAVIVGVAVTLTDANGRQQTTQTDGSGAYS